MAIVGDGYRGILESPSTRIPGLVSIADIAPTAVALARGDEPRIGWEPGTPGDLRTLDRTLSRQQRARDPAVAILALAALVFAVIALALGSVPLARAGILAAPLALTAAIGLSGAGITRPAVLLPLLAALTVAASAAGGVLLGRRALAACITVLIGAYLVVLVAAPTWPALAAIGPNPGEGGRFYGCTNLTTSIVLAMGLFAGAVFGLRGLVPVAMLSLVTVGWSKAGADGGGLVVLAAAFTALGNASCGGTADGAGGRRRGSGGRRCSASRSSGWTRQRAVTAMSRNASVKGRERCSTSSAPDCTSRPSGSSSSWHAALVFAIAIAALVLLARRRPRFAAGDALLVGVAVSLLINDTPQHVAAAGAISYGALWVFERVRLAEHRPAG